MKNKDANVVVKMQLPEKSMRAMNELVKRTEAKDFAEFITNAIRLFDQVVDLYESGKKLYTEKEGENGEVVFVEFDIFVNDEIVNEPKDKIVSEAKKVMDNKIQKAPWTIAQVLNLVARQNREDLHPYTCGNCSNVNLVPHEDGWHCLYCNYQQDWCFKIDADEGGPEKSTILG